MHHGLSLCKRFKILDYVKTYERNVLTNPMENGEFELTKVDLLRTG